jgi:hypothetical protein
MDDGVRPPSFAGFLLHDEALQNKLFGRICTRQAGCRMASLQWPVIAVRYVAVIFEFKVWFWSFWAVSRGTRIDAELFGWKGQDPCIRTAS